MKKYIFLIIILIFLANGCTEAYYGKNKDEVDIMKNKTEEDNEIMIMVKEDTKLIIEKIDNDKSCEVIERVYQYNNIPGYNPYMSALPLLGCIDPNKVECIRSSEDKEYLYIIYKAANEDTTYWVFRFYKLNDGEYVGDSIIFANDTEGLSWILNYTEEDLLDIDKKFIDSISTDN